MISGVLEVRQVAKANRESLNEKFANSHVCYRVKSSFIPQFLGHSEKGSEVSYVFLIVYIKKSSFYLSSSQVC